MPRHDGRARKPIGYRSTAPKIGWLLAIAGASFPCAADAAYLERLICDDQAGSDANVANGSADRPLGVDSLSARLLGAEAGAGGILELIFVPEWSGNVSCKELAEHDWDWDFSVSALGFRETGRGRPESASCRLADSVPVNSSLSTPAPAQRVRLELASRHQLGPLGILPAASTRLSYNLSRHGVLNASVCVQAEVTPQLPRGTLLAARIAPICVLALVVFSGFLTTMFEQPLIAEPSRRSWPATLSLRENPAPPPARAILPGVGDCLLHLQFIFLMGALTVRYPGFYQPVTSQVSWASLFSPVGPIGLGDRYEGVVDGIYKLNGTLTGTYGIELLSQVTGGPMTKNVLWNMLLLAAIVAIITTILVKTSPLVPSIRARFTATQEQGATRPRLPANRTTWNVLKVVLSYFLMPVVAILAYQPNNLVLPSYQLIVAAMLILLVICAIVWMTNAAPSNQLGTLLLSGAKKNSSLDDSEDEPEPEPYRRFDDRAVFTMIFFAIAFLRGAVIGGFQFTPKSQIVILATAELAVLASSVVLRPFPSLVGVFAGSCVARLAVVLLTVAFLPQLRVDIIRRSQVGYAIFGIHAAVLLLACTLPAVMRLARLAFDNLSVPDEPEVSGDPRALLLMIVRK
ncbi:hypothetical protein MAPG_10524 [Magnaporthiopsis poae ATCC 64411]|uniref:TRP C-terminal domain-containing protein n=1 Tax=Magnaporthiopsis poae (strain ATCC 64411 / 73-15) TaxID=644358 RepID=A0A0C4ECT9_MAGP6|nr:hypothetical protein MAPG_10524 [Magnaporthiopsis poae ATCC 64411]